MKIKNFRSKKIIAISKIAKNLKNRHRWKNAQNLKKKQLNWKNSNLKKDNYNIKKKAKTKKKKNVWNWKNITFIRCYKKKISKNFQIQTKNATIEKSRQNVKNHRIEKKSSNLREKKSQKFKRKKKRRCKKITTIGKIGKALKIAYIEKNNGIKLNWKNLNFKKKIATIKKNRKKTIKKLKRLELKKYHRGVGKSVFFLLTQKMRIASNF